MPLTPSLRKAVNPFELSVIHELSRLAADGFVANNLLLPKVAYRNYPDEHDALLLLPWGGYTLDAKNWHGDLRFPGNSPVEWRRLSPEQHRTRGWCPLRGLTNPFHVGKQKASILHSFLQKANIGLNQYPIHPLIVLPRGTTFTPDRQVDDTDGSQLVIRIVTLDKLNALLAADRSEPGIPAYGLTKLKEALVKLEALPRESYEVEALCGYRLQSRIECNEIGCPVTVDAYQAAHAMTGMAAEVRCYRPWPITDDNERFLTHIERRVTALMTHGVPSVLRVLHAEEWPDGVFVAYERFKGESLRSVVERRGPLPAQLVAEVLTRLAWTAHALHTAPSPIVHHDIRPDHVLVAAGLDEHRGIHHRLAGLTNPLIDEATPTTVVHANNFDASFTSPEMLVSRHPARRRPQVDLFSLGRLAAFLLLGDTVYRRALSGSEPIRFPLPDTPLGQTIARAMERRADDRHGSARELAQEADRASKS